MHQISEAQEGSWIALTDPTATEISGFAEEFQIDVDHLKRLWMKKSVPVSKSSNYTLVLVDIPIIEERNDKDWYGTIPLGIIVTEELIFTVCLEDTPVLRAFMDGRVRNFFTYKRTRFILQICVQECVHVPALSAPD